MKGLRKIMVSVSILHLAILFIILLSQNLKLLPGLDYGVLLGANLFFYVIAIISMNVQRKHLNHENPNVFVRSVMGSMMIRMFATILVVLIYVKAVNKKYDGTSIFIGLSFYLIYLAVEVKTIMKLNNNNG
jgi:hypothetical protein